MMKRVITLTLSAVLIYALLILPHHPDAMSWDAFNRFPLELPVILLALIAIGRVWGVAIAITGALLVTVVLKIADFGMFMAYDRAFNPILDFFLIDAGLNLLRDSIGTAGTIFAVIGALVVLAVLFFLLYRAIRLWAAVSAPVPYRIGAATGACAFALLLIADAGHALKYWSFDESPPGTSWTSRLAFSRVLETQATAADLVAFRALAMEDDYAGGRQLFDQIGARDVLIIYIESYGRTSFENPLYAPTHLATLERAETSLSAAGFGMRSGWLTSPTSGGQSWLAHGTLSSGLWTSDQGRYKAMLASGRKSLFHLAQEAGFRTNAVMPAITLAWPESGLMGFDQVFPAADIPYQGAPFNWVTMPDQFTLAAYPALLGADTRPQFTQIALISSHAPWVPIPPVIAWGDVGNGEVFSQWATTGPTPREVWKDHDRVREQYRKAVDYTLQVTFEHVAQLGPDAPLVFVIGDHQPAGFVAQVDSKDVAVHLIAPPDLVARTAHWDWTPGLIPDAQTPVWRMDAFRNRFIDAFTSDKLAAKGF